MGSPTIASLFCQRVIIGVGDMAVSNNIQITLSTYALGSCIGLVAYDPAARVGGILHLMLPDSSISPAKAAAHPAMFADTGLPMFFREMAGFHTHPSRLHIFVAGGASILGGKDPFRIGERNARATLDFLHKHNFPVRHAEIGDTINRTLHLELATGIVTIKKPNVQEQISLAA